jgi:hypothetical protein
MLKIMKELKRQQIMRRIELQDADQEFVNFDLITWKGGSLKRSAPLSKVEWVGDGFSCIHHPQSLWL